MKKDIRIYQNNEPFGIIQEITLDGNGIMAASRMLINPHKGNWHEPFIIKTIINEKVINEQEASIVSYQAGLPTTNIFVMENILLMKGGKSTMVNYDHLNAVGEATEFVYRANHPEEEE